MILLKRSLVADIDVPLPPVEAVRAALQSAIELEHSTIPLYLYALYSLDPAKNGVIAKIIQSVVVEEMLHMTLASNVMNALGGSLTERSSRALAAGCDVLLHCSGFLKAPEDILAEMTEVADAAPQLLGESLRRARAADRAEVSFKFFQ